MLHPQSCNLLHLPPGQDRFRCGRVRNDASHCHALQSRRLCNLAGVGGACQAHDCVELVPAERWLTPTVGSGVVFLWRRRYLTAGRPSCTCAVAAMNAIRLSLTAFWMGSLVEPSKVKPLIIVLMMTPRFMNFWIVSTTSS
jgi:hypothetical protein